MDKLTNQTREKSPWTMICGKSKKLEVEVKLERWRHTLLRKKRNKNKSEQDCIFVHEHAKKKDVCSVKLQDVEITRVADFSIWDQLQKESEIMDGK